MRSSVVIMRLLCLNAYAALLGTCKVCARDKSIVSSVCRPLYSTLEALNPEPPKQSLWASPGQCNKDVFGCIQGVSSCLVPSLPSRKGVGVSVDGPVIGSRLRTHLLMVSSESSVPPSRSLRLCAV